MTDASSGSLILHCIARLALADGRLADAELREIHDIIGDLTGMDVSLDLVRAVVQQADDGKDALDFVVREAGGEAVEVRLLIARAGYRVLAADGEFTGAEVQTFNALLAGLDLSRELVLESLDP
jgi:uncharacterized tellurite resistance protein B-like protein